MEAVLLVFSLFIMEAAASNPCRVSLPHDYNMSALDTDPNPMAIHVQFKSVQVRRVRQTEMTLGLRMWMALRWIDPPLINLQKSLKCPSLRFWGAKYAQVWTPESRLNFLGSLKNFADLIKSTRLETGVHTYEDGVSRVYTDFSLNNLVYCQMDFDAYPFDTQRCTIEFEGFNFDSSEVLLTAGNDDSWFSKSALPFHVELETPTYWNHSYGSWGNHSRAGFVINLKRIIHPYIFNVYVPSTILVIASWISFSIPVEIVPGRMALLVTVLLMMINFASNIGDKSPLKNAISALDIWMLGCLVLASLALFEYAIVLAIRYKWRKIHFPCCKRETSDDEFKVLCERIDHISSYVIPIMFGIFNTSYWATFQNTT